MTKLVKDDHGVTMVIRVNPDSTSLVEPRTPVELAVDEVLFKTLANLQLDISIMFAFKSGRV